MAFKFEIRRNPLCMLAVTGHTERLRGVIACAYVAVVCIDGNEHWVWGYGGAKNTETFYLYGLDAACDELSAYSTQETPFMEVFVFKDGFMTNVQKYVPYWLTNGGKKKDGSIPDAYEENLRILKLSIENRIKTTLATPKKTFPVHAEAKELATRLAKKAHELGACKEIALMASGCGKPEI